jgi:tetratricopeptide (TPR) repeat protein
MEGKSPIGYIGEWNSLYKKVLENGYTHYAMGDIYCRLRLYDEAVVELKKAADEGIELEKAQKALTEVKVFLTFLDDMAEYLDTYYRNAAVSGVSGDIYRELMPIYDKAAVIFPNIKVSSSFSVMRFNEINENLEKKFGANITYFSVDGYMDCYIGYVISESVEKISQWGKEADEKVTIIRDMVSKGFNYWYNLNQSGTCGWTLKAGEFVYLFDPQTYVSFYNWAVSDETRNKMLSDARKISPNPDKKEVQDVYYSQYMALQFLFKYVDSRIQQGKEMGLSGGDLKTYTVNLMLDDYYKYQILCHEGQHALDAQYKKISPIPEYRQKLSEMAYGSDQMICLSEFMQPNMGDTALAHGYANEQIFKDMVKYIYDHKDKYPAIDTSKNILPQMINLKDEEIKEMAIDIFNEKFPAAY